MKKETLAIYLEIEDEDIDLIHEIDESTFEYEGIIYIVYNLNEYDDFIDSLVCNELSIINQMINSQDFSIDFDYEFLCDIIIRPNEDLVRDYVCEFSEVLDFEYISGYFIKESNE